MLETMGIKCAVLLLSCLVLSVICELNFSNDTNKFKSVPTTVKTFANDTVVLPCNHDEPFLYVRWHKDDVLLIDSRQNETPSSNRIYLWTNGSLQVSGVQMEDTGDYYCEIMTNGAHAVQVHAIEVQHPPIVNITPKGNAHLPIGAVLEIICEANGIPQPAIAWRHNGEIIDKYNFGNRRSYLLEIKSRQSAGLIECLATNGVGDPAIASFFLNVLFPPEIITPRSIVYSTIGVRASLECIVEAMPAATVLWFRDGLPVYLDSRVTSHDVELSSNHLQGYLRTKHVLTFKYVQNADFGVFKCQATNKVGSKFVTVELTGRPMPCIFKFNPGVGGSTSHTLVWQTESLTPVIEFKLKFRQIPHGNISLQDRSSKVHWTELTIPCEFSNGPIFSKSYTMFGLQPASIFEVTVLARNQFGWSDNSKVMRFATSGEVELPNYSNESGDSNVSIEDNLVLNKTLMSGFLLQKENSASTITSLGLLSLIYCIIILL